MLCILNLHIHDILEHQQILLYVCIQVVKVCAFSFNEVNF